MEERYQKKGLNQSKGQNCAPMTHILPPESLGNILYLVTEFYDITEAAIVEDFLITYKL